MTHLEFMPYHNRHIQFTLKNNMKLQGVVLDPLNERDSGESETSYRFIPTGNLKEWQRANKNGDRAAKNKLEQTIEILDIIEANFLNY